MWDMEAFACTMMVAVLSSRISFRRGVGSRLSSSIRTERVSLEMRNWRSNFSRFKRPARKSSTKRAFKWCVLSRVLHPQDPALHWAGSPNGVAVCWKAKEPCLNYSLSPLVTRGWGGMEHQSHHALAIRNSGVGSSWRTVSNYGLNANNKRTKCVLGTSQTHRKTGLQWPQPLTQHKTRSLQT